ncbi:hypothetical protein VM1G_00723 [Cytospora mali]|uniref:Uncharacterized protein n=1 Tax=Cytospora mali TaxID=578113 RepID=A0A194VMK4_CYTMA|nr:hypothetical protein VM1G_00723 [Valsa mali]
MDRILAAPEPKIRAILVALCDNDHLRERSLAYLDQLDKHHHHAAAPPDVIIESSTATTSASPDPYGPSPSILGKRKASASPQICIQCRSAFSPGANYPEACLYHDGALLINGSDEVWADWDENTFGPHDTDANRDEYPQGFTWSCCKRVGTKPGCTRAFHVAVRGNNKRLRLPGPGQDPDVLRMFEGKVLRPNEFVNENLWDSWDDAEAVGEGAPPSGIRTDDVEEEEEEEEEEVKDDISEKTERDSGAGSDG